MHERMNRNTEECVEVQEKTSSLRTIALIQKSITRFRTCMLDGSENVASPAKSSNLACVRYNPSSHILDWVRAGE